MRRTFDAHKDRPPNGWNEYRLMPYPASQPDSKKLTTPFVPRTRATEPTTPAPPTRRTRPTQPPKIVYDRQLCYECSVVVDGTGKRITTAYTRDGYDNKKVEFPVGSKRCFSESKQSLIEFEETKLCPANSVCGLELIEERVNGNKTGANRR